MYNTPTIPFSQPTTFHVHIFNHLAAKYNKNVPKIGTNYW